MSTMSHLARLWNERIKRQWIAACLLCASIVSAQGCRLPGLCCPESMRPLPESFQVNNVVDKGVVSDQNSSQLGWNQFFEDEELKSLISESIAGNQELKILAQDIRIAYNDYRARRGAIFPFFNIGATAGMDKASRFTRAGAVEDQLTVAPGKGFPDPLPNFLVAADVSWEIDIWRKLRNARDAATLRYLGTQAGRNYVITRLVSDVAENYYQLLALDNTLVTLDKTIQIQEASFETAKALKEAARGTELAVQRFQAEFQKNQSQKFVIQQKIVEAENRINYIAGRFPQAVARPQVEFVDVQLASLQVGVPSQQLLNRADIRQAERELRAAGLDVKVARAQFYPSLILTAGVGYEAFNTKYLFTTPEALVYNAVGGLVAPVINRSAIKADYLNANAKQLQAVYHYQQTVINAHIEVINNLSKVDNLSQSIEIKRKQLQSLEASVDNATKLFQSARGEYIDVLLSQRDLMEAKLALIEVKQEQVSAVIKAYQALGGGGSAGDFLVDEAEVIDLEEPEEPVSEDTPVVDAQSLSEEATNEASNM
jgi:multidrug efflux system outer membrane protein